VSSWLVVWLVVGLASTAALVAFGLWLARHVQILVRTFGRVQEELAPLTEEISRETARASDRVAGYRMPGPSKRRTARR
jgi:hypothetical protein